MLGLKSSTTTTQLHLSLSGQIACLSHVTFTTLIHVQLGSDQCFPFKVDDPEEGKTSAAPCSNSPLHVAEVHPAPSFPHEGNRACILVDSREITSGLEVISSLRAVHGLQVEVCPLNGCDYIVSNRMVVERKSQAEMLNNGSKNKFIEQIQRLQGMFQRICVIVEKDREKAGLCFQMFKIDYYLIHSLLPGWIISYLIPGCFSLVIVFS